MGARIPNRLSTIGRAYDNVPTELAEALKLLETTQEHINPSS